MKKLMQSLSFGVVSGFALLTFGGGSAPGMQPSVEADQLVNGTPAPAPACGKCGDRVCVPQCGETATSCPKDCGGSTL
jgi:hypothetical protein